MGKRAYTHAYIYIYIYIYSSGGGGWIDGTSKRVILRACPFSPLG